MSTNLRYVHLAARAASKSLWTPEFVRLLNDEADLEIFEDCARWTTGQVLEACRGADVVLTERGSPCLPVDLAHSPGRLRYVCHLTGTLRGVVPVELIRAGIPVTNWGDAPARPVAEGALTLLLACLHNLRPQIETKRDGGWVDASWGSTLGMLDGLRTGLYGLGAIGSEFASLCHLMGARVSVFDPFCPDLPEHCRRVDSLEELFATSSAVSIHAGLTEATRGSVTARHLALLPDGGILINTARGAIVEEPALFAELASGRLRAGLDVLCTDESPLPSGHPARHWPNLILTAHRVSSTSWPEISPEGLSRLHRIALENLARFREGQPLRFRIDEARYQLIT